MNEVKIREQKTGLVEVVQRNPTKEIVEHDKAEEEKVERAKDE